MELAGLAEFRQISGLSGSRLAVLRDERRLPEPVAVLACGTIWDADDIRAWVRSWSSKPGPKPKVP